jgi:hypothetical protein
MAAREKTAIQQMLLQHQQQQQSEGPRENKLLKYAMMARDVVGALVYQLLKYSYVISLAGLYLTGLTDITLINAGAHEIPFSLSCSY